MDIQQLNEYWSDIYYYLHYFHQEKLTHQAIRILQQVQKEQKTGINEVSLLLNVSHNTASEHVKRLMDKGLLNKQKDPADERRVILCLTDKGKEVVYRNTSLDEEKLTRIFQLLNNEERKMIMSAFQLLRERAKQCMSL